MHKHILSLPVTHTPDGSPRHELNELQAHDMLNIGLEQQFHHLQPRHDRHLSRMYLPGQ
ncbi:hypothetical protein SAY86_003369 [Trapa natans]|uniref:Uncharacterized protein n=1 Tax=Trapa natans TaxID=22666 RepID=A0AAN7RGU7_TRANT|nr:hypothetical protein SAY86_003369 [Trapa natans]